MKKLLLVLSILLTILTFAGAFYVFLSNGTANAGYADSKTLEEYGQRQRNINLEDMDMDSWRRVADALGVPTDEPLAPVLERFRKATQRQPLYQCMFHEDDGSLTESYGLMFE